MGGTLEEVKIKTTVKDTYGDIGTEKRRLAGGRGHMAKN